MRYYYDWLRILLYEGNDTSLAYTLLKGYQKLAAQATELLWQTTRLSLPPIERPSKCTNSVATLGEVVLSSDIKNILDRGPKHCFEPQTNRSALVAMVRKVGRHIKEKDRDRVIGEEFECLQK